MKKKPISLCAGCILSRWTVSWERRLCSGRVPAANGWSVSYAIRCFDTVNQNFYFVVNKPCDWLKQITWSVSANHLVCLLQSTSFGLLCLLLLLSVYWSSSPSRLRPHVLTAVPGTRNRKICKQSYCIKLPDKPILSCVKCGQGCHDSCVLQVLGKSVVELNLAIILENI